MDVSISAAGSSCPEKYCRIDCCTGTNWKAAEKRGQDMTRTSTVTKPDSTNAISCREKVCVFTIQLNPGPTSGLTGVVVAVFAVVVIIARIAVADLAVALEVHVLQHDAGDVGLGCNQLLDGRFRHLYRSAVPADDKQCRFHVTADLARISNGHHGRRVENHIVILGTQQIHDVLHAL